jgi:hypothetical protein
MSTFDWDRLVVVSATHGEKFMGEIPPEENDPEEYLDHCLRTSTPVELHRVRNLISQVQPQVGARGQLEGMGRILLLMPIDMMSGPLSVMKLQVSSWYFPKDSECKRKIDELYAHAEKNEMAMMAQEAGLTLAGTPDDIRGHQ